MSKCCECNNDIVSTGRRKQNVIKCNKCPNNIHLECYPEKRKYNNKIVVYNEMSIMNLYITGITGAEFLKMKRNGESVTYVCLLCKAKENIVLDLPVLKLF